MFRRRGNGACVHSICDIISKNKPERNIGFVCESVTLFERHFGCDYKEEVREMALEALSKYGPGTPFEKDERMLPVYRILGKYSRSMTASELYDRLYEKELFHKSTQFYVDWADSYLTAMNPSRAALIMSYAESAIGKDHPQLCSMMETIDAHLGHVDAMMKENQRQSNLTKSTVLSQSQMALNNQLGDLSLGCGVSSSSISSLPSLSSVPPRLPAVRRILAPIQKPTKNDHKEVKLDEFPPLTCTKPTTSSENKPSPSMATFVLPMIHDAPPISPDIVSPSVSQMKPGKQNNFILPPVFSFTNQQTFADAARGGNDENVSNTQ